MAIPESGLTRNVDMLGRMLGEIIRLEHGDKLLEKIEKIRTLAKSARQMNDDDRKDLLHVLKTLTNDEILPVVKAFSHFLNLVNISDQHHIISREMADQMSSSQTLNQLFQQLKHDGIQKEAIEQQIDELKIALVLTAHPTEITRRTLIAKYGEIDKCLGKLELQNMTDREVGVLKARLSELITQVWYSDEFPQAKPTPIDEAKWGMAVVESSLWNAVPAFCRRLDQSLMSTFDISLPLHAAPVTFVSWIGGDRDGNPNVTASITDKVLVLHRWKLSELYIQDIEVLISELSMVSATDELIKLAGATYEPYRAVLKALRTLLRNSHDNADAYFHNRPIESDKTLESIEQLTRPLICCYDSLMANNMANIANAKLLDLIRRVHCFGVNLLKLDVRQESSRHAQCLGEITQFLGLGDYALWNESEKQHFLLAELKNKRPLLPTHWQPSSEAKEVIETCRVIANNPSDAFGAYVISMAKAPSDILAVHLLLKIVDCPHVMQVSPLFETLEDLDNAADVVKSLLALDDYQDIIQKKLMVMIGYSDSAKDAGVMAAGWAQYKAQEELLAVCQQASVTLTLFHGRGGTIGRGGAPAHAALLSQPPGSLEAGLRVTVQGEMIRAKLGLTPIAIQTLALYTSAILTANMNEPPVPQKAWRDMTEELAKISCEAYRNIVRNDPNFVDYFRQATPEQELAVLPLGSRPARRQKGGGIETLRAIPWIFAWSQNRLMLPAWLGSGEALKTVIDQGHGKMLESMCKEWPFFSTRVSMLEMLFSKADIALSAYYDKLLVDENLQYLGEQLRTQLQQDIDTVLAITNDTSLMGDTPMARDSVSFRNTYVDPLNLLQAELLQRYRKTGDKALQRAIMISIAGISAGLRNTG